MLVEGIDAFRPDPLDSSGGHSSVTATCAQHVNKEKLDRQNEARVRHGTGREQCNAKAATDALFSS